MDVFVGPDDSRAVEHLPTRSPLQLTAGPRWTTYVDPTDVEAAPIEAAQPPTEPAPDAPSVDARRRRARTALREGVKSRRARIVVAVVVVVALFGTATGFAVNFRSQRDSARAQVTTLHRSLDRTKGLLAAARERNSRLAGNLSSARADLAAANASGEEKSAAIQELNTCVTSLANYIDAIGLSLKYLDTSPLDAQDGNAIAQQCGKAMADGVLAGVTEPSSSA